MRAILDVWEPAAFDQCLTPTIQVFLQTRTPFSWCLSCCSRWTCSSLLLVQLSFRRTRISARRRWHWAFEQLRERNRAQRARVATPVRPPRRRLQRLPSGTVVSIPQSGMDPTGQETATLQTVRDVGRWTGMSDPNIIAWLAPLGIDAGAHPRGIAFIEEKGYAALISTWRLPNAHARNKIRCPVREFSPRLG